MDFLHTINITHTAVLLYDEGYKSSTCNVLLHRDTWIAHILGYELYHRKLTTFVQRKALNELFG